MTHPIDPTPEPTESASQYRVSAQELSHVVGIIQARKEAEARQRANTVALGEAVEQLGLEMTPDELLAEIQADRARRSGSARPKRQHNTQHRTFVTFAVCAGLAGMMVSSIHLHRLNRAMWESRNNPLLLPRDFAVETMPPSPIQEASESPQVLYAPDIVVTTSDAAQFRPFSQFGENEAADCDFESLQGLANDRSQAEVLVQANNTNEDKLWTIVRQNGEVSVYAFGDADELAKAMNGHEAHLYASMHDGLQQELVPLRLFKNAELVDIPDESGAIVNSQNSPSPFADVAPTHWAYQAVTETPTPSDSDAKVAAPGTTMHFRVRAADYPGEGVDNVYIRLKDKK